MSQIHNHCDCGDCAGDREIDCEDLDNQIRVLKIVKDLLEDSDSWLAEMQDLECPDLVISEDQEDCDE